MYLSQAQKEPSVHFVNNSWLPFYEQPYEAQPQLQNSINITNSKYAKDIKLYKTEFCRNWTELGHCRYNKKCRYAHGEGELRVVPRHNRYKTQICRAYFGDGTCPYGIRCNFIHNSHTPHGSGSNNDNSNKSLPKRRDSIGSYNSTISSYSSFSSNSNENKYHCYFNKSPHNYQQQHNMMLNSAREYFLMKQEQQRLKLAAETVYSVTWGL
ncbi:hypothetical protein BDF20DRAFT_829797 [Mycotypha africana]|uniref:uncharacterized protein n=1 Tax=Mycotypha africana TaxID=64632 RepID=UPI002301E0B6|nr:uncharacterized protein BDF20DRAFT_829797 [Mycotypha africana]KAI8967294.1 hypothetical protein BDF20DRAFT_829797 [Mycotypha africana]